MKLMGDCETEVNEFDLIEWISIYVHTDVGSEEGHF